MVALDLPFVANLNNFEVLLLYLIRVNHMFIIEYVENLWANAFVYYIFRLDRITFTMSEDAIGGGH